MSLIKSLSVGNGDMFYINHNSSNFTIIDCCIDDTIKDDIIDELKAESKGKKIIRFISTHPDDDHIRGLEYLNKKLSVVNFYCVKNNANKDDATNDFKTYCNLRDGDHHFYISKGVKRKWMNEGGLNDAGEDIGASGISILWPITDNQNYKDALDLSKGGESPNNISPIIQYSLENGANILWMGDLENTFMESIKDTITLPKINILFAPHHGRKSGAVPTEWLEQMNPDIIILGEAPSENLDYSWYSDYNTLTQNSALDISLECVESKVHIYSSSDTYSVDFLDNENLENTYGYYIGTLNLN